jgi:hypothetical protein
MKGRVKLAAFLAGGSLLVSAAPATAEEAPVCVGGAGPVNEVCVVITEENTYAGVGVYTDGGSTFVGVCEDAGWHTFRPCD